MRDGLPEGFALADFFEHCQGADGGYTQKDVVEVARCFTGWTIAQPREGGEFRFDVRQHDPGAKPDVLILTTSWKKMLFGGESVEAALSRQVACSVSALGTVDPGPGDPLGPLEIYRLQWLTLNADPVKRSK